ncbi:MAG: RNA-directed DNA polymerase [Clostridia bacterium]|nr:RNA-directed DNA polymerase [Clostridia bacterium]
MKRKSFLYKNTYDIKNIMEVYDEVCRNTKNKNRVNTYKEYKCANISKIYNTLLNREYRVGPYNKFIIFEPKERLIVSQNMFDKIVNHLVARQILMPALFPSLISENVASRKDMGVKAGIKYLFKFDRICKIKYKNYYILKCDISKFFASIDHYILKCKLEKKIKEKDSLKILFDIIDSEEKGLGIGNMTSQILAIFYLNDMDHYIKEELKIKYYVRYQDDFILFHHSKEYLKFCLEKIKSFLTKEKLFLNEKTRIYNGNSNFIYLGRNKYGKYSKYRNIKRRLKKDYYLYNKGRIDLLSITSKIQCYESLLKKVYY